MADRLPLTDVSGEEITSRVIYQLILSDYRNNPEKYDSPGNRLIAWALEWRLSGFDTIADSLLSVGLWCLQGGTVATWLRTRTLVSTGRATILARAGRKGRR